MEDGGVEAWLHEMPGGPYLFDAEPLGLYTPIQLYEGFDPAIAGTLEDSLDAKITYWLTRGAYSARKLTVAETVATRLHDTAIDRLVSEFVMKRKPSVAMMGSHSIPRSDPAFLQFGQIAQALHRKGYLVVTGGGPGLMEAANLGAFSASCDDNVLPAAMEILSPSQVYSDGERWVQTAAEARAFILQHMPEGDPKATWRSSTPDSAASLGIPTWYYGSEPPNLFASHIGKYFFNSLREDGLVSVGTAGIIFGMGDAGTVQEIFQNASLNYYPPSGATAAPMVFVGTKFWAPPAGPPATGGTTPQRPKPVLPLIQALVRWTRSFGQFGGLAKVDSGLSHAASLMS